MTLAHVSQLQIDSHVRDLTMTVTSSGKPVTETDVAETQRMIMTVLAFWHLCSQTIVNTDPTRPERHAEKRFRRAGGDPHHVVRVVRLRRKSGAAPEGEGREWHHQWIVRGHWRQQPCGPGRTLSRPVWIAPYVKGPEGAPLLDSTKVNYLVR